MRSGVSNPQAIRAQYLPAHHTKISAAEEDKSLTNKEMPAAEEDRSLTGIEDEDLQINYRNFKKTKAACEAFSWRPTQ